MIPVFPIAKAIWASPFGRKVTMAAAGVIIGSVAKNTGLGGHGGNSTDGQGTVVNDVR